VLFHAAALEVSESFETLSLTPSSTCRSVSAVEKDSLSRAKSRSVLLHG
jgi:hypothetical protein